MKPIVEEGTKMDWRDFPVPADTTGYMVVISEQTIRRRLLPNRSS